MLTTEMLKSMKKVKPAIIYGKFGGTDKYSVRRKTPNGMVKRLIMELKKTGITEFYQFYKGNDLYISVPNKFEYVFYNVK